MKTFINILLIVDFGGFSFMAYYAMITSDGEGFVGLLILSYLIIMGYTAFMLYRFNTKQNKTNRDLLKYVALAAIPPAFLLYLYLAI